MNWGNEDCEENKKKLLEDKRTITVLTADVFDKVREIEKLKFEIQCMERKAALDREEAINKIRLEMQSALIKSDLLRVEAMSKLEIYEKTDTKADANTIKDMVKQLIDSIGKQNVNIVK